jgi:competence protein CoiA
MPLYASDGKDYVYASDALQGGSYRCIECRLPVKVRRGKSRIPHFYHLKTSPSCRLYSKSEDHLLVQLQIQKLLLPEKIQIEIPFLSVHRIADLLWEREKIVFEIQCSSIYTKEAEARIIDYRKMGYEVIWLLDDRLFNRKLVRPAEKFLRTQSCYFFYFRRNGLSFFYDQLEIILDTNRIKKSKALGIYLRRPHGRPSVEWPPFLPNQLLRRISNTLKYFEGDLIHRSLQAALSPWMTLNLQNWKRWEKEMALLEGKMAAVKKIFTEKILRPYLEWLEKILVELP